MMKFTKTICAVVLLGTISWTSIARADGEGIGTPDGSYRGGGYRVTVSAKTGEYTGFDRQGAKVVIGKPIYRASGSDTVEYKNRGYTYRLTPLGQPRENDGDYAKVVLTIVNPQGRVILNQMMNRVK
jgi:hypothetical protein